jgi:hypothetical protein
MDGYGMNCLEVASTATARVPNNNNPGRSVATVNEAWIERIEARDGKK